MTENLDQHRKSDQKIKCRFCEKEYSRRRVKDHEMKCGNQIKTDLTSEMFTIINVHDDDKTFFYHGLLVDLFQIHPFNVHEISRHIKETKESFENRVKSILSMIVEKGTANTIICVGIKTSTEMNSYIDNLVSNRKIYLDKSVGSGEMISDIIDRFGIFFDLKKKENANLYVDVRNERYGEEFKKIEILQVERSPRKIYDFFDNMEKKEKKLVLCDYCNEPYSIGSIEIHEKYNCEFAYVGYKYQKIHRFLLLIAIGDDGIKQSKIFARSMVMKNSQHDFFISTKVFRDPNVNVSDVNNWINESFHNTFFQQLNSNTICRKDTLDKKESIPVLRVTYVFAPLSKTDKPIDYSGFHLAKNIIQNYDRFVYVIRLDIDKEIYDLTEILKNVHQGIACGFHTNSRFYKFLDTLIKWSHVNRISNEQTDRFYHNNDNRTIDVMHDISNFKRKMSLARSPHVIKPNKN